MSKFAIRSALVLLCATSLVCSQSLANPQLASIPGARANMKMLEPSTVRGAKFTYDHEITVAPPATYDAAPDRKYPVLWVLDAPLMLRTAVGILDTLVIGNHAPEMIVIGVGSRREIPVLGRTRPVRPLSGWDVRSVCTFPAPRSVRQDDHRQSVPAGRPRRCVHG